MKKSVCRALIVLILLGMISLSGCTTPVLINSSPPGAKVYLDNQYVGVTPIEAKVKRGFKGDTHKIVLEKGNQRFSAEIENSTITTGNIVLSILFFAPALFFAWQPEQDSYTFALAELETAPDTSQPRKPASPGGLLVYNFNHLNELDDWEKIEGEWGISNGVLYARALSDVHIELNKPGIDVIGYSGILRVAEAGEGRAYVFLWVKSTYLIGLDFKKGTALISDKKDKTSAKVDGLSLGKDCRFSIRREGEEIKFSVNDKVIGSFRLREKDISTLMIRGSTSAKTKMSMMIDKITVEISK